MNEDDAVAFTLDVPLLGDGCDVIAAFPDGQKKRLSFGSESAARDWIRRGASTWIKKQKRKLRQDAVGEQLARSSTGVELR